jgi:hypothetical protein
MIRGATTGATPEAPRIYKVTVSVEPSVWFRSALKRINQLTALAVGWNSYGAQEVQADMAMEAVEFLTKVTYPGIAAPSIVPLSDGGIQLEWHRGGLDVEVTFSDDDAGLYIVDRESGEAVELPLDAAAAAIGPLAERLRDQ